MCLMCPGGYTICCPLLGSQLYHLHVPLMLTVHGAQAHRESWRLSRRQAGVLLMRPDAQEVEHLPTAACLWSASAESRSEIAASVVAHRSCVSWMLTLLLTSVLW